MPEGLSPAELAAIYTLYGHLMQRRARVLLRNDAQADDALQEAFRPDGINCGYNGGSSAGAGIPGHLHVHMLPRWNGDTNFVSTVGETRVMPQTLDQVWERLKPVVDRLVARDAAGA